MSEIDGNDGNKYMPYKDSGIKEGDMIREINGKEISNTQELINIVNNSDGKEISIKYERNGDLILYEHFTYKGKKWRIHVRALGKRCCSRYWYTHIL